MKEKGSNFRLILSLVFVLNFYTISGVCLSIIAKFSMYHAVLAIIPLIIIACWRWVELAAEKIAGVKFKEDRGGEM